MAERTIQCELGVTEYEEVLALWQRAGLPTRPEGRDAPAAVQRQLEMGMQRIVGLRQGTRLVAVVILTHDGRKGWINRLAVDPECRRKGLARQLVAEAERWFTQDLGLEVWAALIESENEASLALFDSIGFAHYDIVYVSRRVRSQA